MTDDTHDPPATASRARALRTRCTRSSASSSARTRCSSALLVCAAGRRPRAARGRPRPGEDADRQARSRSVLGGTFGRVQFTPDLVPADLIGTRVYRPDSGTFDIELGPVFANFLLADEINRAPAKVQSALLEVMQERQVTIGGETLPGAARRSSSWRRRTRSSPRAPTRCPRPRSTAS